MAALRGKWRSSTVVASRLLLACAASAAGRGCSRAVRPRRDAAAPGVSVLTRSTSPPPHQIREPPRTASTRLRASEADEGCFFNAPSKQTTRQIDLRPCASAQQPLASKAASGQDDPREGGRWPCCSSTSQPLSKLTMRQ
ncbi:hypothetical protein EJB05_00515, partial [Eragrostis curvula]